MLGCSLLLTPHPSALAAEGPATPQPITIPLEYRETESDLIALGLAVESLSHQFSKEPALSGRDLRRGRFSAGSTAGFGFIWDQEQARLYLDLNRNGDLSDDPDGQFAALDGGGRDNFQQFENVELELPIKGAPHRVRVNLNLYAFGRLGGSIALRSYWSGKLILQEREWELGIVPLVHGEGTGQGDEILLLRPWTVALDEPQFTGALGAALLAARAAPAT